MYYLLNVIIALLVIIIPIKFLNNNNILNYII